MVSVKFLLKGLLLIELDEIEDGMNHIKFAISMEPEINTDIMYMKQILKKKKLWGDFIKFKKIII